jgi:lipopolysaccharide export system permease protein
MLKIIDRYIFSKFLKTFFFTVLIFTMIAMVVDFSERVEEFIEKKVAIKEIVFDYYLNWILWINGLLFPMYAMIAVIFFTSRMAYNTEIISILSAGVSFRRIIRSYMIPSALIFVIHLIGNHYVIPLANKVHYDFQHTYVWTHSDKGKKKNVHLFIGPETKIYVNYYRQKDSSIIDFRLEGIKDNQLAYVIKAKTAEWLGPPNNWRLLHYERREFSGDKERLSFGKMLDTTINLSPKDFVEYTNQKEMMDTPALREHIHNELERGGSNVKTYQVELYRRTAEPFTIIILTLIGLAVASRKVRGGMGFHLAIGIGLGAVYIFLSKFSATFAIGQYIPPVLGVWIPNIIFFVISVVLILRAQR